MFYLNLYRYVKAEYYLITLTRKYKKILKSQKKYSDIDIKKLCQKFERKYIYLVYNKFVSQYAENENKK
jgi:hypothetical protein